MGTPDGIEDSDWEHVTELAAKLCDAVEGSQEEETSRRELLAYLDQLENKYGPLLSILATRGDFAGEYEKKERLLTRAYTAAVASGDGKTSMDIAHSLAAMYIEELLNVGEGKKWLERLDAHLLEIHDPTYADDAKTFRRKLTKLDPPGRT